MTLTERGYRMPAEWEPHAATWLAWPHKEASWPGKLHTVPPVWCQLVRALAEGEDVHINVVDARMRDGAMRHLKEHRADAPNVFLHEFPTNDAWTRDHGPIFVTNPAAKEKLVATKWGYNAWGGKYPPFDLDNRIPFRIAEHLRIPLEEGGMILEGGSIDVNGAGVLLTTEQCLLNPNRNPQLGREEIESRIMAMLGVRQIHWLGEGIEGDDTDGHVDDITRFVAENTIATVVEPDTSDYNHKPLAENAARLRELRNPAGGRFDIVELPMPDPVVFQDQRLPASYANFYIGNAAVVVPIFGHGKKDDRALGILRELFPGRRVVGVLSNDLVWGLGAFHCITQQQPKA